MLAHACNPIIWNIKADGSEVQGHPHLHTEFDPGYNTWDPILKKKIMFSGL